MGKILFIALPLFMNFLLAFNLIFRVAVVIIFLIPLGFLLGVPFPSAICILHNRDSKDYVPWMNGINGTMTVFGSIVAAIISTIYGFTQPFFIGIGYYFLIIIYLKFGDRNS